MKKDVFCPSCGYSDNKIVKNTINYVSPNTGQNISIKNVEGYLCLTCNEDWQTAEMFKKFQKQVQEAEQNS